MGVHSSSVLNSNDNTAEEKLDAGKTMSATDELNALINQIETYNDGGKLSSKKERL
jgi:hypothetical protein